MAEYTEEQWQQLRDRWKGHEEELRALIPVIKAHWEWNNSDEYKALMKALGPLPEGVEEVKRDLRGVNLRYENLCGANLLVADLSRADLQGANLSRTDLVEADLYGANLRSVNLFEANLVAVNLSKANLGGADLYGANLGQAKLYETGLRGAVFSGANMNQANLSGADLRGANLSNSKSWLYVTWNSKHRRIKRFARKGKKLRSSGRKTRFGDNDIRNANWAGATLLRRYVEDENFLSEYIRADFPWWRRVLRWLWKWTCNYGRSFKRWAFVSLVLAIGFGLIYMDWNSPSWLWDPIRCVLDWIDPELVVSHSEGSGDASVGVFGYREPTWFTFMYFSVVTFTTLGFGDVTPLNTAGEVWLTLEVITGYIMLGGLISIFANKLARRA